MSQTPLVIENPREMRAYSAAAKARGERVGFVPTMGALHQGHLSLIQFARQHCDRLVVSIFVNPLQFNQASDLDKYPRTFPADSALCAGAGVDVIYFPDLKAMYPEGFQTKVSLGRMTEGLCGAFRPGHFDGVTTVVLKLFNAVLPDIAAFGEKDYQQLAVIQRMAADLDLAVEVVGRPTGREPDGLALSSRNVHLSAQERAEALCLWRGLCAARALAQAGETHAAAVKAAARAPIAAAAGIKLEYLEIVDSTTLEPLTRLDRPARMAVAAWAGGTRLIDNLALNY
ncbi:MAG: pantoate--beta-alanine ligase [Pseudomonadota bacterium]